MSLTYDDFVISHLQMWKLYTFFCFILSKKYMLKFTFTKNITLKIRVICLLTYWIRPKPICLWFANNNLSESNSCIPWFESIHSAMWIGVRFPASTYYYLVIKVIIKVLDRSLMLGWRRNSGQQSTPVDLGT